MISYSRRQEALARLLHDGLMADHLPKLDCLDIGMGERFQQTLAWWLSACHVAVVLLSREAMESPWVRYELSVLVNRELVARDVTLIVVLVGGAVVGDITGRPDLAPLGLQALQLTTHGVGSDDAALLDAVVEAIAKATGGDPGIAWLAALMHEVVAKASITRAAAARAHLLGKAREARDPWLDDPAVADQADRGVRLRWALAHELCAHTLHDLYGSLQELAQDRDVSADVQVLVDRSLMATVDSAAISSLYTATTTGEPVVLGLTEPDLSELVANAVGLLRPLTKFAYAMKVNVALTGNGTAGYVQGIVEQIMCEVRRFDEEDPRGFLDVVVELGHPVFVLLCYAEGLSRAILDGVAVCFPGVGFVVVASRQTDPQMWSVGLDGLKIAGPQLTGSGWEAFVDAEADLVACGARTRKGLAYLLKKRRQ